MMRMAPSLAMSQVSAQALPDDPMLGQIQERATATDRILAAAEARPDVAKIGVARKVLVDAGSAGLPYDGEASAAFAVIDIDPEAATISAEIHRATYDMEAVSDAITTSASGIAPIWSRSVVAAPA